MKRLLILICILLVSIIVGIIWGGPLIRWFGVLPTPTPSPTPLNDDRIILTEPLSGQRVTSPLRIRGSARGTWFFEASFPVELRDANGSLIAQTTAQARDDWMTEQYVPFEATLPFTVSGPMPATLILRKDNPSGLPQYDESRSIPVILQ